MNSPYLYYVPIYPYQMMDFSRKLSENSGGILISPNYLTPGDKAPVFTLEGIVNGQPKSVSLSDYTGKWVVLFFYSLDFSFV